jgi:simple sugar transport system permease protein
MNEKINGFIRKNKQFIPLTATALLAVVAYTIGAVLYPGMRNPQVFLNIFKNNSYILVSAVGMTLVILTGGIDLSVSGMVALTSVVTAALLRENMNAWLVIVLMLLMGMALGGIMGYFITYLKAQPWIATLAGMWFTRGLCFFISDDAISIKDRTFDIISRVRILIPGVTEISTALGNPVPYISIPVVISLLVYFAGIILSKYTRFGRTIYAIGGNEGRNEQSARLMGLPVNRTKLLVYTLSGFCSALAGILFSLFVSSGHGLYAAGLEMDVIASVVMGGTMLTGGVGYVFGTIFGVFIFGLTQTLIQFNGTLSSWWTKIVIGLLTLLFIGVQSLLSQSRGGRKIARELSGQAYVDYRKKKNWRTAGIVAGIVFLSLGIIFFPKLTQRAGLISGSQRVRCELQDYRRDLAEEFINEGAIIVYERNGGPSCIDEIFAIFPDGTIVGDNGIEIIEKQLTTAEIDLLMAGIINLGWFTDQLYDTWHIPCGQCYGYYLTVVKDGQVKTVKGVDGGTDAPVDFWQVISLVKGVVPNFD